MWSVTPPATSATNEPPACKKQRYPPPVKPFALVNLCTGSSDVYAPTAVSHGRQEGVLLSYPAAVRTNATRSCTSAHWRSVRCVALLCIQMSNILRVGQLSVAIDECMAAL